VREPNQGLTETATVEEAVRHECLLDHWQYLRILEEISRSDGESRLWKWKCVCTESGGHIASWMGVMPRLVLGR
jgi:hypothetical protein